MKKDLLIRFFEGKTSFEEEKQIREWMESSTENYKIFLKERKIFDAMILCVDEKSAAVQSSKKIHVSIGHRFKRLMKMAAVIAVAIGITIFYQQNSYKYKLLAMQHIEVPSGQRIKLKLSDGTIVWINSDTKIEYPAYFIGDKRTVKLEGEAYFEVEKDLDKPFIVETSQGNVEVMGTKFNVEVDTEQETFTTALMEGSVKVEHNQMHYILQTNQIAYLENGKLNVTTIKDHNIYKWKDGLICFNNESFENIMKKLEKYYGVDIKVENPNVLNYQYTGKFRQSDGIMYALKVLQKDVNFKFSRDLVNHIIYIK